MTQLNDLSVNVTSIHSGNRSPKVWFITGSSRGFGRVWTEAALKRGDKVVATARKVESIAALNEEYGKNVLTLELDVTNSEQVRSTVEQAFSHFGRIDVILNNAAYSLVGSIEEPGLDDIRTLYETNVFGPVSVIQAALPFMRKQGGGHIVGVSSSLGHFTLPVIGYYCSTKWAFEAIHESLATEVKQFGVNVTIIEPGAYDTDFGSQQSIKFASGMEYYKEIRTQFFDTFKQLEFGDPNATPNALFKVIDTENPPLRFFLGSQSLPLVRQAYSERLALWEEWKAVSDSAQGKVKKEEEVEITA